MEVDVAISPEEAGRLSQSESKVIQNAENEIDERLRSLYQGSGSVEITSPLDKLSERARREVLSRFSTAGWDIRLKRYEADQRDPREVSYDSWIFSAGARPSGGTGTYFDR